ncbi:uncharacterized protein LOC118492191 [Helianthus annuus]|uniref:uncharacterized protein LOC118492191 n=1 Tax=Helianthus annuus TaxID=4232 RepID=UPI001652F391|nr:uncharacterized protein LOC118492191 [Helianthus annuus]
MEPKIHPAATVTNIKSLIPVVLEMESGQYASWSELFKIQCRASLVIDHLSPRTSSSSGPTKAADKDTTDTTKESQVDDSWDRLDAIVLQWIYATISNDLLHTILKPNTTAYDAWKTLEGIFQDNKSSRSIHLLHKFSNTRLDGFPNVSAYCQQLKVLADQLANVGSPVDYDRLVLQLIAGLNDQYAGIATILQQQDPLPNFYEARSKVMLVESRKAEQALLMAQTAGTALNANSNMSQPPANSNDYRHNPDRHRGRGRSRGRGRGRNSWGRGRHNNTYNPQTGWPNQLPVWPNSAQHQSWNGPAAPQPASPQQWAASQTHSWVSSPCPYPTAPSRPNSVNNTSGSGLLGPRPTQAHNAYAPTDIEQALYTMSLNQPDPNLYMDTGATGLQDPDPYPPVQQQR